MGAVPKILLASVFGPYGVDDEYGRKENINELFHNQVTREQGLFSPRFNHQSFGLYMIADNLQADVTVLDFPSQSRFVREIERNAYDYIGISFILPNFVKAKRMAELIRLHAPGVQIVLGGHGTSLPDIEKLIDCDHICRGEGIAFMRKLLGETVDRPISHPVMPIAFMKRLAGVPLPSDGVIIMPGVGCPNACRFCCTSHFFNREYTPFFHTGREIFDFCLRAERERNTSDFWIMDENFLKQRHRAEELLAEMEKHDKQFNFYIFSSAETIREVGVEFMQRLGVTFLWLGMEGRECEYEKNQGIDLVALVKQLRTAGITVLGSVILFTERHDKQTIQQEIDFAIEAGPDFVQFMQLAPWPDTQLYREYRAAGLLREDIPFEEWHGQHLLWFKHPHFTPQEASAYLRNAFIKVWDESGCSVLRMIETNLFGYLSSVDQTDPLLAKRNKYYAGTCRAYYPLLYVIKRHAHNRFERDYAENVIARFDETFGPADLAQRAKIAVAQTIAASEAVRIRLVGNMRQPRTVVTSFPPAQPVPVAEKALKEEAASLA